MSRKGQLNFDDPAALVSLTKTLLLNDFKLDWSIPCTRLCPAVPNRINYLLWVEDLLAIPSSQSPSSSGSTAPIAPRVATALSLSPPPLRSLSRLSAPANIYGIDIGTGASAIFPLLGCRMNDAWNFVATEVDDASARCALDNVNRNVLGDRIHILRQDKDDPLLARALAAPELIGSSLVDDSFKSRSKVSSDESAAAATEARLCSEPSFAFLMCNPPFFERGHILPKHTATGKSATDTETICEGGEVGFVARLARESAVSCTRVRWFTSMLGKQASLQPLMNILRELGASSILSTRLVQGKTMRWAIAWSFLVNYHSHKTRTAKRRRARVPPSPVLPSSSSSSSHSSSSHTSPSPLRVFTAEGVSAVELSRRLHEYVHEEQSSSDFLSMRMSLIENKGGDEDGDNEWLISADSPMLRLRIVLKAGAGGSVVSVGFESPVDTVSPMLLDRTLSKIERDLKRTGRYWRRKQKFKKRRKTESG